MTKTKAKKELVKDAKDSKHDESRQEIYDLAIIGGGPGGLSAAIYAARFRLKSIILTKQVGGQLFFTHIMENYPGLCSQTGMEITEKFVQHVNMFKIPIKEEEVINITKTGDNFSVRTNSNTYTAKTVLFATGTERRKLGAPGETKFSGKGVSYCAVCLPPHEDIIANSSIKNIGDVTPLTEVLTIDGTYQAVNGFTKQNYEGKLVRITPRFFTETVQLTPNHPVLMLNAEHGSSTSTYWKDFRFSEPKWVEAGRLKKGDCVIYPIIKEIRDASSLKLSDILDIQKGDQGTILPHKKTHTAIKLADKIVIDNDFLRLAGYYLAEGSASGHQLTFYFGSHEHEYIEDVKVLLSKVFGLAPNVKRIKGANVCAISIYSKVIADMFKVLFGKYSFEKSVPHWAILLPHAKQKELVKGFWRGDGCTRHKDFSFVTNSRKLTYQLRDILLRLGVIPSLQVRRKIDLNRKGHKIGGRDISFTHDKYQITVGGQFLETMSNILDEEHKLIKSRSRITQHAWIHNGMAILPVRNVEEVDYKGTVLNIAVNANNTYVAKNFVVHNCDGPMYKDKIVGVVGGSDSAAKEALFLARYAKKAYIIYRREKVRAEPITTTQVEHEKKIEIIPNANVTEIKGKAFVESVTLEDVNTKKKRELALDGIFIEIGGIPGSSLAAKLGVKLNEKGEIEVNQAAQTNVAGIFAAGDVTNSEYKQVITAASQGVVAVYSAYKFLKHTSIA